MWLATGLLAGGAIGNLIDRVRVGSVTDFIDLPHWPPFNLADAAITCGVVAARLRSTCAKRSGGAGERRAAAADRPPRRRRWRWSTSRPGWSSTRRRATPARPWSTRWREILGGGADPERPGIVHRLDKGTSGLLVVARDDAAHAALQAQVQRREVERVYLALAGGRLGSRTGTIDAPIGRSARERHRMAVSGAAARQARTHFEVLELLPRESYVEVKLETGRTHQIRAHFAAIGHPLTGDATYGGAMRYGLDAPVPARPPARLLPPGQRRAAELRLAAAGGPRGGAGSRPRR